MNHQDIKRTLQQHANETVENINLSAELGMYYTQVRGSSDVEAEIEVRDKTSHGLVIRLRLDASNLARLLGSRQCLTTSAVLYRNKFHGRKVCQRVTFTTPPWLYGTKDKNKAVDHITNQMARYIIDESLEDTLENWRFLGAHLDNKDVWTGTYEMFHPYETSLEETAS